MKKTKVALIGAGKVGSTLALALRKKGCRVVCVLDRIPILAASAARAIGCRTYGTTPRKELCTADFVILAVPDGDVGRTAEELTKSELLRPGQVVCHTSGFLPAYVLVPLKMSGAKTASFHPMFSVAKRLSAMPPGPYFGLEGDRAAVAELRKLVKACGWSAVAIRPGQKALYHAACVLATGMNAALLGLSQEVFDKLGFKKDSLGMVRSLAFSVAENLAHSDIPNILTGPLVRGQVKVVAMHLKVLKKFYPRSAAAYRALGMAMMELIGDEMKKEDRKKVEKILKGL